jgi:DNA polymerase-3 subunit beta
MERRMKFKVEKTAFADAVGLASRAASTRNNALPALSGVKLELSGSNLTVTCTDNDLAIRHSIAVNGISDGTAVTDARRLSDVVKVLEEGAVTISLDNDAVTISSGRSKATLRALVAGDFPPVAEAPAEPVSLPAAEFAEALRQVVRAAARDLQKPQLTGVLMAVDGDGMRLVATDSFRLAVKKMRHGNLIGARDFAVVPSRALAELLRMLGAGGDASLSVSADRATFRVGAASLSTSLVSAEFPKYEQLIAPQLPNKVVVEREPLLHALRRCRVLARENTPVRLEIGAETVRLVARTTDGQEEFVDELDSTLTGAELVIGFNPEYLADGVEAVSGESASIETSDPLKPAVIRGVGDDDYLYLLMPQRLSV